MKSISISVFAVFAVGSLSLIAPCAMAQRMPQDSWYLKKTVETGVLAGGIARDNDGNIYLSDTKLGLIKKYSSSYQLLQTWGGLGTGNGQFGTANGFGASGLCFDASQNLVVCDPVNHRIQIFSRTGAFLRKFGSSGTGDGQFAFPAAAAVSSDNKIFIADRDNHRIQAFSATGTFLSKFGQQGGFDGQLQKPSGLCFLPDGNMAVADTGNGRIQVFSQVGGYVRKISGMSGNSLTAWRDGTLALGFIRNSIGIALVIGSDGTWSKSVAGGGSVKTWGSSTGTQPTDLGPVVQVAAGSGFTLALRADGTLRAWGASNSYGQTTVPSNLGPVVSVAAGASHAVVLQADGIVKSWGRNDYGQTTVPTDLGVVVAVAAGQNHSVALLSDGKVRTWGSNGSGQGDIPTDLGPVVAIAANYGQTIALQGDGMVRAWGKNDYGQTTVPADLAQVTAIASGYAHTVALQVDGKVRAWGNSSSISVPADLGPVAAIAAGGGTSGSGHTLALLADGTVRAWGANSSGQATVPTNLASVGAIAAGYSHSVAIEGNITASNNAGLHPCAAPNGDLLIAGSNGKLHHYARTFRTILPETPNAIPMPVVLSTTQRPGTSLVDIDFRVDDADDATVQVAALAFKNGGTALADVIPIKTLVEGTANKLGAGVATGQVHRLTWDARADVTGDFEQVKVEILAKDARGLFNLDYIQIPAEGAQPALKISKTPLKDADFNAAMLWLIATGDPEIAFADGKVARVSDAVVLATNSRWLAWNITQSASGSSYAMSSEFEVYNGAMVLPMTGVTATGPGIPNNLKDGSLTTEWQSSSSGTKRVVFQFPAAVEFDGYRFATGGIPDWRPVSWSLQTSNDGVNWTTVDTKTNATVTSASRTWTDIFKIDGSSVPEAGRAFLLARMGLREATAAEILRAQEAGTPGVINQWTPPLQVGPGERPVKVNAYGFETGDTGTWVVPVTP